MNQINTSIKLSLTVSLNSKDFNLIKKFENVLNKSELIYNEVPENSTILGSILIVVSGYYLTKLKNISN